MKTRKARLSEKAGFTVESTIKELRKQSALIGGIKNNEDYNFYDIKSVVIDIIETLESQAEGLRVYADMVESASDN